MNPAVPFPCPCLALLLLPFFSHGGGGVNGLLFFFFCLVFFSFHFWYSTPDWLLHVPLVLLVLLLLLLLPLLLLMLTFIASHDPLLLLTLPLSQCRCVASPVSWITAASVMLDKPDIHLQHTYIHSYKKQQLWHNPTS